MPDIIKSLAVQAEKQSRRLVPLVRATSEADNEAARATYSGNVMSFREFVELAWPIINPGRPLRLNWHIEHICRCLQAISDKEIKRLIINIPPGLAKSVLVSVLWPVWRWMRKPSHRFLTFSHTLKLSQRDALRSRDIIQSDWFNVSFAPSWSIKDDQNEKGHYMTSAGGLRHALAVASKGSTGHRGDTVIIDDPLDATAVLEGKINLQEQVEKVNEWFSGVIRSRIDDPDQAEFVVIMQRLHENDLSGYLQRSGKWNVLSLPAEYDPDEVVPMPLGLVDPRKERGELLFPMFHSQDFLDEQKSPDGMGPVHYMAQYNQNPTPRKGDYFYDDWFQCAQPPPVDEFEILAMSVDATLMDKQSSDNVSIGVWGRRGLDWWRLDEINEKLDFRSSKDAIRIMYQKWPTVAFVLVENKANGPALISDLRDEIPVLVPFSTKMDSKIVRVLNIQAFVQNKHLWLPIDAPWREAYIKELTGFPRRSRDDRVDETSQLLIHTKSMMDVSHMYQSFNPTGIIPPL